MAKKSKKENTVWKKTKTKQKKFLAKRPHRSFQLTRRRDYSVKLPMPGYASFTVDVFKMLFKNKNTFLLLILVGVVLAFVTSSFMAQGKYIELVASLREVIYDSTGELLTLMGETGSILFSLLVGGIGGEDAKNPYSILIGLLLWLTSVWLVRNIMAGKKVSLREGLYNSGGPVLSTALILLTITVQAVPAIIAIAMYNIAGQSGLLEHGAAAMAAGMAIFMMALLSLYWISATFIAMIIVTLPNMYPMEAIRLAGDLVSGIRLRVLYRVLWMIAILGFIWAIILGLVITFDILMRSWLEWFINIPIVPIFILVLAVSSIVFISVYLYMLYISLVEARYEKR